MNLGFAGYIIAAVVILTIINAVVNVAARASELKKCNVCKVVYNLLLPIKERLNGYFKAMVFLLPLIFSILRILNTKTGCCEEVQWHFGLFAIVFGWANLIRLFSNLPFIGQHSIVFKTIVWTFVKLAVFGLLLVLASVVVLTIVFFDSQALVSVVELVYS